MKPYERYYADTSPEEAQPALELLLPMAHSAFTSPTSYAGWKDYGIPCTYIKCLQDKAVTVEHWDTYLPRMRDAGVDITVEELDCGHSPFWINPDAIAELLVKTVS
jgi:pimeloyl-ACP methyl ester carboxylesterase